jgi:molybdopterin-guanine dinucleotide biosynthesis protein A
MPSATASAAILAGGRARRFGGIDKSRLAVDGHPIIVRQVAVLQRVAAEVFVAGGEPDRYSDLGLRAYPDSVPGAGAIGGILTAVERAHADVVLVVACDLPFLDAGVLGRLLELSIGRDGAWVHGPRGVEPLVACYRRGTAGPIRGRIERGEHRASDLGQVLDMAELAGDALAAFGPVERLLATLNTAADYARIEWPDQS